MGRGFVASILLHVVVVAVFLLQVPIRLPSAALENNVNVELVPQPEEQPQNATKPNGSVGRVPTPTPKPDEKPQQQAAVEQKQEVPVEKADGAKGQSDKGAKPQAEKTAPPAKDPASDVPASKPEPQTAMAETPLPDMKGDEQKPSTIQQPDAKAQADETSSPNNTEAKEQAATPVDSVAQPEPQASATQSAPDRASDPAKIVSTDTNPQQVEPGKSMDQANSAPPAKAASMAKPEELVTSLPSDQTVSQPETPATEQPGLQTEDNAAEPLNSETDKAKATDADPHAASAVNGKIAQAIAPPAIAVPRPEQSSQQPAISDGKGEQTNGTSFVPEPAPRPQDKASGNGAGQGGGRSGAKKSEFVEAKKLFSGSEMAKMSKSQYDAWKQLPRRDRVRYLCQSEEKLQYGHDLNAVGFMNSALSQAMISDTGHFGNGVAVQTPKGWQQVKFTCQVDDDALKVVAFSHAVVGRIPKSQLDRLGLPEF
ncbi:MAG: DUF930 domain-containing protein [Rhizobium sp.]